MAVFAVDGWIALLIEAEDEDAAMEEVLNGIDIRDRDCYLSEPEYGIDIVSRIG